MDEIWGETAGEMLGEATGVLRPDAAVEEDARDTLGTDTGAGGPRILLRKSVPADWALTGTGADPRQLNFGFFKTFPNSFLGPFPETLDDF